MPEDYTAQPGDCISSIAFERGFFWQTIWDDGGNASLKSLRKDPNVLYEGDVVYIPDLRVKEESGATEQKHKFKLKGVPAKLKLKLMQPKPDKDDANESSGSGTAAGPTTSDGMDPDYTAPKSDEEPIANANYVFEADGVRLKEGKTGEDGTVEIPIPPNARVGLLTIDKGKPSEKVFTLDLGGMEPVEEIAGVRLRLINLGFCCEADGPEDAPDLVEALSRFQEQNSLEATGKIDDATRNKLKDKHGS